MEGSFWISSFAKVELLYHLPMRNTVERYWTTWQNKNLELRFVVDSHFSFQNNFSSSSDGLTVLRAGQSQSLMKAPKRLRLSLQSYKSFGIPDQASR